MFTKCAENLENGRRLENFSWRLWYREAHFFDNSSPATTSPINFERKPPSQPIPSPPEAVSDLSESVTSASDLGDERHVVDHPHDTTYPSNLGSHALTPSSPARPDSSPRRPNVKHLSPDSFKSLIESLEPPSAEAEKWKALKARRDSGEPTVADAINSLHRSADEPRDSTIQTPAIPTDIPNTRPRTASEIHGSPGGTSARSLQRVSSSIVRGFTPEHPSISRRLTPLEPPESERQPENRKKPKFFIASSASDSEDEYPPLNVKPSIKSTTKSNLSPPAMKRAPSNGSVKRTHFHEVVDTKILSTEDDDEDDDSAVVSDDDDEEWEDSQSDGGDTNVDEHLFDKRQDTHLTSQSSILSNLFKSKSDYNLSSQAFRSNHLIRSRTSPAQTPRPQPISPSIGESVVREPGPGALTSANLYSQPIPASPRSTRRKMLASELSESLRRNLLWERQHRTMTNNTVAAIKRRHTSNDLARLKEFPEGLSRDSNSSEIGKYAFDSSDAVW